MLDNPPIGLTWLKVEHNDNNQAFSIIFLIVINKKYGRHGHFPTKKHILN